MRRRLKKVTSILFILITLFSMFTFSSVTADAAGQTVINLKQTGEYSYTSGWGRTVIQMQADSKMVYCVQPNLPAPPNGTYRTDKGKLTEITSSNKNYIMYRKALYYCYGGDGYNAEHAAFKTDESKHKKSAAGNTPKSFMTNLKLSQYGYEYTTLSGNNLHYMFTHLLVSYIYYGDSFYKNNMGNYIPEQGYYNLIKELYNAVKSAPTPSITSKLYMLNIGSKYQQVLVVRNGVKLQLQKASSNGEIKGYSLAGAKYNVYLDKKCTDLFGYITTKENGFGVYGAGANGVDVPLQNYYCKEVTAPKGYELDKTVYEFKKTSSTVDGSAIYKATVTDRPLIHLQLIKSSANPELTDDISCYSLEGAVYGIYKDSACTKAAGQIVTDKDGYGTYINSAGSSGTNTATADKETAAYQKESGTAFAYPSDLENNTYYAKEVIAPKGYELDKTVYSFKDSGSLSSDGIKIYRAYSNDGSQPADNPINDPIGIVLQKRNSLTGETVNQGLEGAVFEIQYYAQEIDKDYDINTNGTSPDLSADNLKRTWYIKTDKYGYCELSINYVLNNGNYISDEFYFATNSGNPALPIGTIVIKEVEAPKGYTISDTTFYRRITAEGAKLAQDTNKPIEVPIDERPSNGYIGIHKMDNNRQGVANAVYGLYEYATAAGIPYDTLTTNADGKNVFSKAVLTDKTYYIKELEAPPGYPLDATIYPIAATLENSTVETAIIQDIYEEALKGDIVIKKTSNDGIVSNLYFALSDNLGNTYNAVATDNTGTANFTGLPVYDSDGNKINYTVKELGFKTSPGTKSYGGFTWTVKAENCIYYRGAYYEGVANNTFSDCEYAYSRYYYANKTEAVNNSKGYTKTLAANSAVTFNFNNTVKTTDIEINKQSYDGNKSGFYFKIVDQNGKYYGDIKTNDNGVAKYSDYYSKPLYSCITVPNSGIALKVKYRVEELGLKNPGSGTYFLPDNYISNVITDYKSDNLSSSTAITFDVYNKPDTGSLNIIKSSDDGYISGLWFKVSAYINWADEDEEPDYESTYIGYDSSGNEITEFYLQTDSSGKASANSLVFYDANGNQMKGLPVYVYNMTDWRIDYQVTELGLKASNGTYYLPKRYVKNDDVTFNLIENRNYTYNCHNTVNSNGKLQVLKTSEDNEISSIWFNVRSLNVDDIDINIVTGEDGAAAVLENLPIYVPSIKNDVFVEYEITELGYYYGENNYEIPSHYKTPESVKITLNESSEITFASFNNQLKKGSVILQKQSGTGGNLSGAVFKLYKSDGVSVPLIQTGNGQYACSTKGKTDLSLNTSTTGALRISQLPYGDYYFMEEKSPINKMPYEEKIKFTINNESTVTSVIVKNHTRITMNTGGKGSIQYYYLSIITLAAALLCVLIYFNRRVKFRKCFN